MSRFCKSEKIDGLEASIRDLGARSFEGREIWDGVRKDKVRVM